MKNIFTILMIAASFTLLGNNPIKEINDKGSIMIKNEFISLSIDNHAGLERLRYDKENEQLVINSNTTLIKVSIVDDQGELFYQIPLNSKKLRLSMDLFEKANYKLVFKLEDESSIVGKLELKS